MASALPNTATNTTDPTTVANIGFRLGDEKQFSDSDSDQSQTSKRSLSPRRKGEVSKSKNRKKLERRAMGALTDDLVDVLGVAFAAPTDSQPASTQQVDTDQSMLVDSEPTSKKLSKRTRQNLKKMQERQAKNQQVGGKRETAEENVLRIQTVAAKRRGMTVEDYQRMRNSGGGRTATKATARRQRKEKSRAMAVAAKGDEMEIE